MKRKASNRSFDLFIRSSWEKSDGKGNFDDFKKICEVKWQEMTDKEKEEYNKEESCLENNTSPKKRTKKVTKKDPNKPKRPRTSYLLFCDAFREEVKISNPGMSMTGVVKELSGRWKALSLAEKQKYIEMADKEKKKYQEILNGMAVKV